ncbi:MAG TPA: precorrin-8X methylmutase [Dongiaceae bacterium]|jgi:precorrin-8X/cobalt-precorrin-8 methylmutase|nr:precorrin-8X methylmutase [Dongiaceae bacterium]
MGYSYLRDPAQIYARSFADIDALPHADIPPALWPVVRRVVHACAMPEIIAELRWEGDIAGALASAVKAGRPILVDARMVKAGLHSERASQSPVSCILEVPEIAELARREGTTRTAAGMGWWRDRWEGAIIAIGNAPTALFRLLEELEAGAPRPAGIIAFPIGFVGAAESKAALMDAGLDVPYLTLPGRFGGSALAAAALNALREM